jgi:hypothetical protein
MTRAQQLASMVRAAAARLRRQTYDQEIKAEFRQSLQALMNQIPGGSWR